MSIRTNPFRPLSRLAVPLAAAAFVLGSLSSAFASDATRSVEIPTTGTWSIESWTTKDDRVEYTLEMSWRRGQEHWGSRSVKLERIPGLEREKLTAKPSVVHFEIRRDAGTFVCDGHVGNDSGAGLYELELDPAYADALAKRGIGRPDRDQQVRLALSDASFAFLDELEKQHYPKPDLDLLVKLCNHGVDREYLDGMGVLGYRFDSFDALLKARDHGVDPRFVEGMRAAGFGRLEFDELLMARDHGVDPRYISGMRGLGYAGLSMRDLLTARDHGVDAQYVQAMAEAGYEKLPLTELIRSRDNGVDGRYVAGMAEAGYKNVALADLVRARQHGVDGRVAKRINARLSEPASLERLIQIHDRGGVD